MARLGRSQPHAPIFLRAPLAAAAVVATLAPQIHVVGVAARRRQPPPTAIVFERAPAAQLYTAAPQFTLVTTQRRRPDPHTAILVLRAPAGPPPVLRLAPQLHVLTVAAARPRRPIERRAAILFLSPNGRSVVPARLPVAIHVVLARAHPARAIEAVLLRAPLLSSTIVQPVVRGPSRASTLLIGSTAPVSTSGTSAPVHLSDTDAELP